MDILHVIDRRIIEIVSAWCETERSNKVIVFLIFCCIELLERVTEILEEVLGEPFVRKILGVLHAERILEEASEIDALRLILTIIVEHPRRYRTRCELAALGIEVMCLIKEVGDLVEILRIIPVTSDSRIDISMPYIRFYGFPTGIRY